MRWQKTASPPTLSGAGAGERHRASGQVFEAACQSGWGGKPEVQTIRRLMTESEVAVAGNSKFRFVGADAFSPDELRTDLFSDDEGGYVDCVALDAALLEKLQAVAEFLREAEGWEWCADAWSLSVSAVRMPEHTAVCRSRKRC